MPVTLLSRLVVIQQELKEELEAVGGILKVGIYNRNANLGDPKIFYEFFEMDGEVALVVANVASLNVLMDMFFLSGITIWMEDLKMLESYLPPYKGWKRSFSRYLMKAL